MRRSLFLAAVEATAKTVRTLLTTPQLTRPFREPFTPTSMQGEEWLTEAEADTEVWDAPLSADFNDEPNEASERLQRNPEVMVRLAEAEANMDKAVKVFLCDNCGKALGDICTVSRVLQGMFCSNRCVSVAEVRQALSDLRANPPTESPVGMQAAVEDPSPDVPPASGEADSLTWADYIQPAICDVLANHAPNEWHVAETHDSGVQCFHCDYTLCSDFNDRYEWREHVAELIAARVAALPQAQK